MIVNIDTINLLIGLNHQFYQTFGKHFSDTRQRLQPGVRQILKKIPPEAKLLDLGCGNGELLSALITTGFQGEYYGLDFSKELMEIAKRKNSGVPIKAIFMQSDLTKSDWETALPTSLFDFILAFSVLHHLPGKSTRQSLLRKIHSLLNKEGQFIHSEWQFLNSERLKARIQDWRKIKLHPNMVEEGDYLLDWKHGGYGLRYVHHFNERELECLAQESGFFIQESFLSDGENGKLGRYQIWKKI